MLSKLTMPQKLDPVRLEVKLEKSPTNDVPNLTINTLKGEVFGPQPSLAIETISKEITFTITLIFSSWK